MRRPTALSPPGLAPPLANYSHALVAPADARLLVTSGQLGVAPDGTVPEGAEAQARLCLAAIGRLLAQAGAGPEGIVRLNAYVTDRAHMAGYMAARDAFLGGLAPPPASTLVIVGGFTRPEFVVEVEATAVVP